MTEIRDPVVPKKDITEIPQFKVAAKRSIYILAISAIALTVTNLLAGFYVINSSRELSALEDKLNEFRDIEKHIIANVDEQTKKLELRIIESEKKIGDELRAVSSELASFADAENSGPVLIDAEGRNIAVDGSGEEIQSRSVISPANSRELNVPDENEEQSTVSYERIEGADGKVYYKKIR